MFRKMTSKRSRYPDSPIRRGGHGIKNKHPQRTAPELKQPGHALRMLLLCGGHAAKNKKSEPFSFEKRFGSSLSGASSDTELFENNRSTIFFFETIG